MTRSYYELFEVAPSAPAEEIKRAFRREIAKYHPDKVQHLGREFQEIAASKAAALTRAYKTLSDDALRADYDAELAGGAARPAARPAPSPDPPPRPPAAAVRPEPSGRERPTPGAARSSDRAGADDVMRRAALARFRQTIDAEFGRCDEAPVQGFEIVCAPPRSRFWGKLQPRVLARFVARVDAAAVAEGWALAARIRRDDHRDACVFVMGPDVAPAAELARAIAEERRKPMPGGVRLTLVPLNTRSWSAYVPNDAPPVVRSLLARLKSS